MLKDKVQEQERALSELICYKDQLIETQQQLKESQHTALTTTQQAEVMISTTCTTHSLMYMSSYWL